MTAPPEATAPRATATGPRLVVAGVWLCLAAAVAYILTFNPTDRVADPTGPCLWHTLTGLNGPTCGGTRMVWYLLHGDLVQAARHHLVALVGVPFALCALAAWAAQVGVGRRWPTLRLSSRVYIAYGAAWLLYSVVLRNLPWPPFTWFDIPNLTWALLDDPCSPHLPRVRPRRVHPEWPPWLSRRIHGASIGHTRGAQCRWPRMRRRPAGHAYRRSCLEPGSVEVVPVAALHALFIAATRTV